MYFEAIRAAGGEPVELSNELDDRAIEAAFAHARGLLLTGGGDVDPAVYGQTNQGLSKDINARRDRTEILAILLAMSKGLPILGVCRGLQVLNVAFGGQLLQDIPHHPATEGGQDKYVVHEIRVDSGSILHDLWKGDKVPVNSYHHQAIDPACVSPQLQVIAQAQDGVIEAVQAKDGGPLLAVQFHPERLGQKDGPLTPHQYGCLFKWLINKAL
jgi:putative glutamine amidotransferase